MNKIALTIEQDFQKNTRKIITKADVPKDTELRVSDKRSGVHASFDRRSPRRVEDHKPDKRPYRREQTTRPNVRKPR